MAGSSTANPEMKMPLGDEPELVKKGCYTINFAGGQLQMQPNFHNSFLV